jgi:hypothetical protein
MAGGPNIGLSPGFTPVVANPPLPTQFGQSGKVLGTNGTSLAWTSGTPTPFNEVSTTIAAAGTMAIGAALGNYLFVTGSGQTITAFDTVASGAERVLEFAGSNTVNYNATTMLLPGAANLKVNAGDVLFFRSEGSGNWRLTSRLIGSGQTIFGKGVYEQSTAPTISGGTLTLDLTASTVFNVAFNANIATLTVSNPPASGGVGEFVLRLTGDGTLRTTVYPASFKWRNSSGTVPTNPSVNGKILTLFGYTLDAGTTYDMTYTTDY